MREHIHKVPTCFDPRGHTRTPARSTAPQHAPRGQASPYKQHTLCCLRAREQLLTQGKALPLSKHTGPPVLLLDAERRGRLPHALLAADARELVHKNRAILVGVLILGLLGSQ